MNLIKPEKLKAGDKIAFAALSGAIEEPQNIVRAKKYFEDKGYKVVLGENIFDKNRYLAGEDEKKIEELHKFFKDPEIKMILCARGGYGAIRLIDKIDFDLIGKNPKIFAGYSDASAIEAMIYKKTGLITFYAPMAQSDFGVEEVSRFSEKSFFNTVTSTKEIEFAPDLPKIYKDGEAKGVLWGGNLATIASLCGQDFIPDEDFIFFAEDLNEPVYKIDKMMTQLLSISEFSKNLKGIILGDFLDIENQEDFDGLFFEIGAKINKPILSGFKITHAKEKITLPYGAVAAFSTDEKILQVEKYLKD